MGEYYDWVNIDKREYISPSDFDLGNKIHESASADNPLLGALYDLLASDWKGDRIIFLGDQTNITDEDKNPVLQKLLAERKAWGDPGYDHDYVAERYKCISGLFKAAEKEVRHEIEGIIRFDDFDNYDYNRYRVNRNTPFEGLFARGTRFFRYTINHSKREFFDIENTKLSYTNENGILSIRINPLPLLMAFPGSYDKCTGLWLGDQIEVTDILPPADYRDMSMEYFLD